VSEWDANDNIVIMLIRNCCVAFLIVFVAFACKSETVTPRGQLGRDESVPILNYDFKGLFPASIKTVGLVMPASVFDRTKLDRAIQALKLAGYQVKLAPRLNFAELASAEDRAADLVDVWTDPEVDLVLCIRGGSGAEKIVPHIDWERLRTRPDQIFLGFSDITILHNALLKHGVGRPISGPMISSIPRMTAVSREWMARTIAKNPLPTLQLHALKPGAFSGLTCGGHAHRFSVVLRQGESVDTKGRVVLLESECSIGVKLLKDTLEYLIDSGAMKDVAGVIFGDMTPGGGSSLRDERELKGEALAKARAEVEELKCRFAERVSCPVYDGFDYGHGAINYAVDHLRRVTVDENGVMRWE